MSDTITILNGGEAPHAARAIAGATVSGADQADKMQLNGGQAPEPAGGSQGATPSAPGPSGGDASGNPPLGGIVHAI